MSGNLFIYLFLPNSAQNRNLRLQNKEELFNLRHSSARNAIKHIFGVLKCRFRILLLAPEYSLEVQARIPAALSVIHNFISIHNPFHLQCCMDV
jgi:DDE superfamily endonuclease